jgi:hypothetical protein
MDMIDSHDASCPYCGETIELVLDLSAGGQEYIEDCEVCCRPITICVSVSTEGLAEVEVRHEDD